MKTLSRVLGASIVFASFASSVATASPYPEVDAHSYIPCTWVLPVPLPGKLKFQADTV